MMNLNMTEQRLRRNDGGELVYHRFGQGPQTVVLANGLGGTHGAFAPMCRYLFPFCNFISWDYRGLYRSEPPAEKSGYALAEQTDDVWRILDAEQTETAIFLGWSMGTQICLEAWKQQPKRLRALISCNGSFGAPFRSRFPLGPLKYLMPRFLQSLGVLGPTWEDLSYQLLADQRWIARAAKLSLVAPSADLTAFTHVARECLATDVKQLFQTLAAAEQHDPSDCLTTLDLPVLLITGSADRFTPARLTHRAAKQIKHAEVLEIPNGTHYTPLEFPELVALRIEKFLTEHTLL